MSNDAFLLTRGWRDTPAGIEIELWAATATGPVRLLITGQEAVCFIERERALELPAGVRRIPRELALLEGGPVDALYCRRQSILRGLRELGTPLCESDVKPADRWLMERFIRAGMTLPDDPEATSSPAPVRELVDPVLRPKDVRPALEVLSLDIETRGSSQVLYSVAGAMLGGDEQLRERLRDPVPAAVVWMIGRGEPERRDGYTLHYASTERELLEGFFGWARRVDPDVITGWSVVGFDLNFIDRKCRELGMPFALARGEAPAVILQPTQPGSPRVARVPGRAVLDGIELLKAAFILFESYSLDNVSHELLGTGKLITSAQDKVGEIDRLFREDKPALADYNITDCTLVNEVLEKAGLIEFAIARAALTGLPLDRLAGAAAAFDNLYLPPLHRKGHVAPDVRRRPDAATSPGGHVMDSVPGLYDNVLVLDFKSLYPSIIRTFFVDPLALAVPGDDAVPGFLDARFSRTEHILPGMIDTLWNARDEAKARGDGALSKAIKIIMNSFYGVLGTDACRFFDPRLAASITRRGHEIITGSRDVVEAAGYPVIYGDTDSLFVHVDANGPLDAAAADAAGARLVDTLNAHWNETLRERFGIESRLEIQFEIRYARFLMPTVRGMPTGSKKRYAGLVERDGAEPELVVKGLEAVRTDWTPLAREFQRELFRRVFLDEPFERWILDTRDALLAGDLDDRLAYRKRLRRDTDAYQRTVPAHVQAARKLQRPGNWIRYVITRNGPEPVEAIESAPDYQHYIDRQLGPAADGILQFLDTSFASITDAQLSMF